MADRICEIPGCPAFAVGKKATCLQHATARIAKALGISRSQAGKGGKRCLSCQRFFKPEDWVLKEMQVKTTKSKAGDLYGHRHVACDPPTPRISKKKIRESQKPLFEDTVSQ